MPNSPKYHQIRIHKNIFRYRIECIKHRENYTKQIKQKDKNDKEIN